MSDDDHDLLALLPDALEAEKNGRPEMLLKLVRDIGGQFERLVALHACKLWQLRNLHSTQLTDAAIEYARRPLLGLRAGEEPLERVAEIAAHVAFTDEKLVDDLRGKYHW